MPRRTLLAWSVAVLIAAGGAAWVLARPRERRPRSRRPAPKALISQEWFAGLLELRKKYGGEAVKRLPPPSRSWRSRHQYYCARGLLESGARELVPGLTALLEKEERYPEFAAWALGELGPGAKAAVPALIRCAKEYGCEYHVVKSLGNIGSAEAVPYLVEVLERGDVSTAGGATSALLQIGRAPPESVKALERLLDRPEKEVRTAARRVLRKLGEVAAIKIRATNWPISIKEVGVEPERLQLGGQLWGRLVLHEGLLYVSNPRRGVAVVELASRRLVRHIPCDCACSIVFAAGRLFIAESFKPTILVYDPKEEEIVRRWSSHKEGTLAASPDGKLLYSASNDRSFSIIDTATGKTRTVGYPGEDKGISAVKVSPDGRLLYLGIQRPASVTVYDLRGGRYLKQIDLVEYEMDSGGSYCSSPTSLAFSPDGKRLYAGMFQSPYGVYVIDAGEHRVLGNFTFPVTKNVLKWPDPLSIARYKDRLVVVNRNRFELALVSLKPDITALTVPLGGKGNGPGDVLVAGDEAVVSHTEFGCLLFLDLAEALRNGGR